MTNVSTHARAASPLKGRPGGGPRSGRAPRGALAPIRSVLSLGLAVVCAVLGFASTAHAEEQPAILKAYGLDWIERVREEAWPQPKAQRPVICLLDTGVAITPDTPADNPEGPIVARLSVEDPAPDGTVVTPEVSAGTLGLPQGTTGAHLHGTRMAALIGAPRNGVGTVGVFPQARIVSVRVTRQTDTYIAPTSLGAGIRACSVWAVKQGVKIAAIVLAESSYDTRPSEVADWARASELARALSAVFVAAQGNSAGAAVVAPKGVSGVVSISAGDESGAICSFARDLPVGDVIGPGCSSQPGFPPGSSTSTAIVGAAAAAWATRFPASSPADREAVLKGAAEPTAGPVVIDGRRLLSDGFADVVVSETRPEPAPTGIVVTKAAEPVPVAGQTVRLWRPSVRAIWKRRTLEVVRFDRRRGGRLVISVTTGGRTTLVRGRNSARRLRVRAVQRPARISAWIESSSADWRSLVTRARVKRR